jgi:anaerobic C4-dicarboxylate transporter
LASVKEFEYAKQLAHWQTQLAGIVTVNGDMLAWLFTILHGNGRAIYIFFPAIKIIRKE